MPVRVAADPPSVLQNVPWTIACMKSPTRTLLYLTELRSIPCCVSDVKSVLPKGRWTLFWRVALGMPSIWSRLRNTKKSTEHCPIELLCGPPFQTVRFDLDYPVSVYGRFPTGEAGNVFPDRIPLENNDGIKTNLDNKLLIVYDVSVFFNRSLFPPKKN